LDADHPENGVLIPCRFTLIAKKRDITLDEMVERLAAERSVKVVRTAVWTFLDRRDQTHKKRPRTPQSSNALT
jgi:transposase